MTLALIPAPSPVSMFSVPDAAVHTGKGRKWRAALGVSGTLSALCTITRWRPFPEKRLYHHLLSLKTAGKPTAQEAGPGSSSHRHILVRKDASRIGQVPGQGATYCQSTRYSTHLDMAVTTSNYRWGTRNALSDHTRPHSHNAVPAAPLCPLVSRD